MNKTTQDNSSYYRRQHSNKAQQVYDFAIQWPKLKKVYDVGCNNGDLSYRLQKELGRDVYGIDSSVNLTPPADYNFKVLDIVEDNGVYYNDLTLFLSLYHHLLGAYGLEVADDVFFKLLLRSKVLTFDTGNVSERSRINHSWNVEQAKHFKTEKQLLDHFGIKYDILGTWNVAGGSRKLVAFYSDTFDTNVKVIDQYRRYAGRRHQSKGLIPLKDVKFSEKIGPGYVDSNQVYHGAIFSKLQIAGKTFFAKKHCGIKEEYETMEKGNIIEVYNTLDSNLLIKFYGFSEKYGFIYEWLDDFEYIGKADLVVNEEKTLKDVDLVKVNELTKYFDFLA